MKKFLLTLTAIFICTIAYAHTINWHVGNTILETTTCDSGESITPPTAPYKYGYHFSHWDIYTPIEYLESTGTQYIDTGVSPTVKTVLELKGIQGNGDCALFGVALGMYAFNNDVLEQGKPNLYTGFCGDGQGPFYISLRYTPHVIKISKSNGLVVDGTMITSFSNTTTNTYNSMFLFARRAVDGTVQKQGNHRIYYTKMWNNDILVRDFIPVIDKDGVPCMYDKVEKKFYYNQGTGQFIAGPVISE